jgi:hypothetical protein
MNRIASTFFLRSSQAVISARIRLPVMNRLISKTITSFETFEKRAVGHCEEAKGRRSNPVNCCVNEIASG